MESKFKDSFFTKGELDKLIDVYIGDIINDLPSYIQFKGLLLHSNGTPFYADGFFNIEESEWGWSSHEDSNDVPVETCFIRALTGTKFSNNDTLIGETFNLKTTWEKESELYNYDEFKILLSNYNIPLTKDISELTKLKYNYNVLETNQKSNFTLNEASKIAANQSPLGQFQNGYTPLSRHYLELLSDCVKDQHQSKFHLITKELTADGKNWKNGDRLSVSANVDPNWTIISKTEFLRWCSFMDIDTGLTLEPVNFDESLEKLTIENKQLKEKNQKLEEENLDLFFKESKKDNKKEFNQKLMKQEKLIKDTKESTFPSMTLKLQVMLKAQNEFWSSYDEKKLPSQQEISNFIAEKLGLTVTVSGTNRTADELAKAIQPDHIKRK